VAAVDDTVMSRTEHPRPLLRRAWDSLDGPWEFALGDGGFDREIQVPFAPECPASGIGEPAIGRCAYRRVVEVPPPGPDELVLLHLGAIDRVATISADGVVVGVHEGGYTPVTVDVTEQARSGAVELVVRVEDDPADHEAPRGKQDWRDEPHLIWYPRTTGIWRTVWLERVPRTHVSEVAWSCDVGAMAATATVRVTDPVDDIVARVVLRHGDRLVGEASARVIGGIAEVHLTVGDGSIDDRWGLVWWPRHPVLLDAEITLVAVGGEGNYEGVGGARVIDRASSYTALREVNVRDGRFLVNGRPTFLRLVLDQGYWPDTGMTPPDVDALRRDLELARALGFNGVRKHQKVEDPRFLALADELGMMVWIEMPSAYRFSTRSSQRLLAEWAEVVIASRSHPSVVAWVPVNESWGVPGIATDQRQRALAEALAATARALDGTRPVSVNDGWETTGGDIVGVHDYAQDPAALRERYADRATLDATIADAGAGPSGKVIDLDGATAAGRAVVLSEFGGINLADGTDSWGYASASSSDDLLARYRAQWAAVHDGTTLAGACWTQLTDTYQEANGLLRADRTPKADLDSLSRATRGRPAE
jgi:beta-galactosidase/beta-glucuronidase